MPVRANRSHQIAPAEPSSVRRGRTEPERLRSTLGNQALQHLLLPYSVQAKLTVSQPGDPYEQEADRVADEVMRMPEPGAPAITPLAAHGLQKKCASCEGGGGPCAGCTEEEEAVQRKTETAGPTPAADVSPVPYGGGQPLAAPERSFFESRFGRDFSGVRVHTGAAADASARSIRALAYTHRSDIVFRNEQYAPQTAVGQRLLAHELTHVLQQSRDGKPRLQREELDDELGVEQELAENELTEEEETEEDETLEPGLLASPKSPPKKKTSQGKPKAKPKSKPRKKKEQPVPDQPQAEEATEPSSSAVKAIEHAQKLKGQTSPAIWFDSWGNDLRDNDLNSKVDDAAEQKLSDGSHYGKPMDAKVCKSESDTTDSCPAKDQSKVKVSYKVCIDIPIESYQAAGLKIPTTRWIPTFFGKLRSNKDWTVWKAPAKPKNFLAGDIVAAANPQHQHAGIVEKGLLGISWVINIPGPTAARKFHLFKPSGLNDMVSVPASLFETFLSIDWVARPNK